MWSPLRHLSVVGSTPTRVESPTTPSNHHAAHQSVGPTVRPQQALAPEPQSPGPAVGPSIAKNILRTDGQSKVSPPQENAIILAPLQWEVRQLLQGIAESQAIVSVRQIANQLRASMEGCKKAIRVLKKIGIIETTAVRNADVQGFRVRVKTTIPVRKGTLKEARGIVKRSGLIPNSRSQTLRTNPPVYVCQKNTYMQAKNISQLLQVCPEEWEIREATLIAIADCYPDMDPTTFRLSLLQAVKQAKEGKTVIKNPNAWLKAAFEKNKAPLLTARDIEARVMRGPESKTGRQATLPADHPSLAARPGWDSIFRQYVVAPEEQIREIDRQAEERMEKMRSVLDNIGPDKRKEILAQARLDAARAVLAGPVSAPGDNRGDK